MIGVLTRHGLRSRAKTVLNEALKKVLCRVGSVSAHEALVRAVSNARPFVEARYRRVDGMTYQVPVPVPPARGQALAIRHIVSMARKERRGTMAARLAKALLKAYWGTPRPPRGNRKAARLSARAVYGDS